MDTVRAETAVKMLDGWKGGRPWVRLENRACPARSPKTTSGNLVSPWYDGLSENSCYGMESWKIS